MPVKLRLKRMGSKKRPFYRIIATDSRMPRDGRFIETLGYYNPMPTPAEVKIDEEGVFKWLDRGAVPTTSAASLLRQAGYLQKWELMKQGVTGETLNARVEAIVAQRAESAAKRAKKKTSEPSTKAKAKAQTAEAEKAEAQAKAEKAEAAPKTEKAEAAPKAEKAEAAPKAEKAEAAPKAEEAEAAPEAPSDAAEAEAAPESPEGEAAGDEAKE